MMGSPKSKSLAAICPACGSLNSLHEDGTLATHLASREQRDLEGGRIFPCPGSQRTPDTVRREIDAQVELPPTTGGVR